VAPPDSLLPHKMARDSAVALAAVPIFAGLPKRQLERIVKVASAKRYDEGARMVVAGDRGESFFVMLEGTALVTGGASVDVVLGPGDFFGEMSLLDGAPRSATVTAESPVQVMILTRSRFTKLLQNEPSIGIAILKQLARRIRVAGSASSG
jgi:CRP/FNR family transcriptional regulator, cyclic AMP receptor protein